MRPRPELSVTKYFRLMDERLVPFSLGCEQQRGKIWEQGQHLVGEFNLTLCKLNAFTSSRQDSSQLTLLIHLSFFPLVGKFKTMPQLPEKILKRIGPIFALFRFFAPLLTTPRLARQKLLERSHLHHRVDAGERYDIKG